MFHSVGWICTIDKLTVPLGSGEESSSPSHSEIFLMPKLHKILFKSVEFMSMPCIVNVSIARALSYIASSEFSHTDSICHTLKKEMLQKRWGILK